MKVCDLCGQETEGNYAVSLTHAFGLSNYVISFRTSVSLLVPEEPPLPGRNGELCYECLRTLFALCLQKGIIASGTDPLVCKGTSSP